MFWKDKRVVVTGGAGFFGSHLVGLLEAEGCRPFVPRSHEYDLRTERGVRRMLDAAGQVDVLFNLAANVGGIGYNQAHPYRLFLDNVRMGTGLIHHCVLAGVRRFVQVGTVCAYPKHTPTPFQECSLWDGYPEETNAPYGLAKRVLLVQLQAARAEHGFSGIYALPTNLYGPHDNFDPARSHVIPALIRKFAEAEETGTVTLWGSGRATRDFLYVEDAARGLLLLAERYDRPEPVNLGSGQETSISVLAHLVAGLFRFTGQIAWDRSRPDGQPRRVLDSSTARDLGWRPQVGLAEGLRRTVEWYAQNYVLEEEVPPVVAISQVE